MSLAAAIPGESLATEAPPRLSPLRSWTYSSAEVTELVAGAGLAIQRSSGNIIISDTSTNPVKEFTGQGLFVREVTSVARPAGICILDDDGMLVISLPETIVYVRGANKKIWGSSVQESRKTFTLPSGIIVDGEGLIWMADKGNNRILKFTKDGKYLSAFSIHSPIAIASNDDQIYVIAADPQHLDDTYVLSFDLAGQPEGIGRLPSFATCLTVHERNIYLGDLDGRLAIFNGERGLFSYAILTDARKPIIPIAVAVFSDGEIFVRCETDRSVYVYKAWYKS